MIAYVPAMLFAFVSAAHGIPRLRHDWAFLPDRASFISNGIATLVWYPSGVGGPRPYPTDYLLAELDMAICAIVGAKVFYVLFMFATGSMCIYGARALVRPRTNAWQTKGGCGLFALFNPWVYTELVAGHLGMILAYGATMALIGESLQRRPRPYLASLLVCLSASQMQFFFLMIPFAGSLALRKRGALPFITGLIVALPTVVGTLFNSATLAAIPYTLDWQAQQSVRLADSAALSGYFANYLVHFPGVSFDAVWSMAALAAIGFVADRERWTVNSFLLLAGALSALWASGLRGPIARVYSFAILHVSALELFRELYDLVAFVAIAYVALAGSAARLHGFLRWLIPLPGLVLVCTWFVHSPWSWWIPNGVLPSVKVSAPANTRVAFMPDVQPLRFNGLGSGLDPDAFARASAVSALNDPGNTFPANVALRRFAKSGDASALRALGVSEVLARPWLSTDAAGVAFQFAVVGSTATRALPRITKLAASPELGLVDGAAIVSLPPAIGSGAIYFDDVNYRGGVRTTVLRGSPGVLLASEGWVDARLAFTLLPELGQGIGGVIAVGSKRLLDLPDGPELLVSVIGELRDERGALVSTTTGGYRWVRRKAASAVRCFGRCVVVAAGEPPGNVSQSGLMPTIKRVSDSATFAPWLIFAKLAPAQKTTLVRYAVGYENNFQAITFPKILPHVRVETAVNGWIIARHRNALSIWIVEPVAISQFILEMLATVWVTLISWKAFKAGRRRRGNDALTF